MEINKLLNAALQYAEMGFVVAPLLPHGKRAFKEPKMRIPTNDKNIIRNWWKSFPNANIGLPAAPEYNGLIIIDVDISYTNGNESLAKLLSDLRIVLPDTTVVRTGSGGLHYYFRHKGSPIICCSHGRKLGIDIRANRGHAVAPPSIHKNGRAYELINGSFTNISEATKEVIQLALLVNDINKKEAIILKE